MGKIKQRLLSVAAEREKQVYEANISATKIITEKDASGALMLSIYNGKLCIGPKLLLSSQPFKVKGASEFIEDCSENDLTMMHIDSFGKGLWDEEPPCLHIARLLTFSRITKLVSEGTEQTNELLEKLDYILSGEEEKNPGLWD